MTTTWWERARSPAQSAAIEDGAPRLLPGGRPRLLADLRRRVAQFVPEWRPAVEPDAGDALIKLFGVQVDPIIARIEQLDERSAIEFLSIAGLSLDPARPAASLVAFTAAPAAPGPVIVPQGFPLGSAAADGSPDEVSWEIERAVAVVAGEVAETFVFDGESVRSMQPVEPVLPFGTEQRPGSYLLLGLETSTAPKPSLSLGLIFDGAERAPSPVAQGGEVGPAEHKPVLRWEALSAGRFVPIEIIVDDSAALTRTGAIELRMPASFTADRPVEAGEGKPRRWLRLRLLQGRQAQATALERIVLNAVPALSVRTIRDELPLPFGASAPRVWRLSQAPILPGSVVLEVDEGALSDELDGGDGALKAAGEAPAAGFRRWREVESLAGQPPDARVFVLDPVSGMLEFGDDVEGRAPPPGNRNVVARRYRVAAGRSGAVEAGSITQLARSLPHLKAVTNPLPASGGADAEVLESALRSGPARVRARGRAVSPNELALFAGRAPGANVARAFALRGIDPGLPGARVPGVVGLFIVPARRPNDSNGGPPIPDSETLARAAAHLAWRLGPLGARVVAAAPRYHSVRIEATLEVDATADAGAVMRVLLDSLDAYLSPYDGGDARIGWPLGQPIRYSRLIRRMLDASPALRSVPYLAIVVDDIRKDSCEDAPLSAFGLPWPAGHELLPIATEAAP